MYFLKKLREPGRLRKLFVERLTEPLHLNFIALFVMLFGSLRSKIDFDLILRPQHAYSLLKAADRAKRYGFKTVTVLEFGVAAGSGLLNIAKIGRKITKATGVEFKIYGFDTGKGMPPGRDYRDHPEMYEKGDFPMDVEKLKKALPENVTLILGDVAETLGSFFSKLDEKEPIGFVSVDVDYYYSTVEVLKIFTEDPKYYLPLVVSFFDDVDLEIHNNYCGELLAINEFNEENKFRKIEQNWHQVVPRVFKNPLWIRKIFSVHILDHITRSTISSSDEKRIISNPYLK